MLIGNSLDQLDSMYPTKGFMFYKEEFFLPSFSRFCSIYGYSYSDSIIQVDNKEYKLEAGQYFGLGVKNEIRGKVSGKLFLVLRLGYIVPNTLGWIEKKGRLSYIDGCSDSLLVYPSRLGDGSLNLLYFPPGTNQSFHRHPSIRVGCVVDGYGFSNYGEPGLEEEDKLSTGLAFSLSEQERHRFRTESSSMTIIAYHPDGDWGPTDHNHTMLNRTYVSK